MSCAICLKIPKKLTYLIDINNQKKIQQNIAEIIQKYMWIKPDNEKNKFICTICWKSLSAFHKFYTQIQMAHEALEDLVNKELINKTNDENNSIDLPTEKDNTQSFEEEEIKMEPDTEFLAKNFNERLLDETAMDTNVLDFLSIKTEDPINSEDVSVEKVKERRCKLKKTKSSRKSQVKKTETDTDNDNEANTAEDSDEFIAKHFKLLCCLCDTQMETFTKLKQHFRTLHNQHGYVICCKKKLLRRCLLIDHINYHRDPNYFKCTYCEKVFCSRSSLDSHVKVQHESDEPLHQCQYCLKRFFNRTILNQHVLIHAPENEKTVPCPKCEKCFVNKYTMNKHLRLVHLNTYAKVCHICGKLIRGGPSWVKWHIEEHAGVEHAFTQCEICYAKVRGKYGMKRHMRLYHTLENQTPQICAICGKESATLSSHKSHMKYVHTMERKHACTLCDKVFKRPLALKEHMTTHTGERLYTCPHCPKTFNSSANMHSHRKKAHPKEFEERRREKQREMYIEKPIEKKEL